MNSVDDRVTFGCILSLAVFLIALVSFVYHVTVDKEEAT